MLRKLTSESTNRPGPILVPKLAPNHLLSYCKGLGLMRITNARGYWRDGGFYLEVESLEAVAQTFLEHYQPKAIASPWNQKAGFLKKRLWDDLLKSSSDRYGPMRETYRQIIDAMATLDTQKGSKDLKPILLPHLSKFVRDSDTLDWLAACMVIQQKDGKSIARLNDLLGTGGNVGANDLGATYVTCCQLLFSLDGQPTQDAEDYARSAIAGAEVKNSLAKKALLAHLAPVTDFYGELDSGSLSSDYPGNGDASSAMANPVDFILAIEGLLMFGGTVQTLNTGGAGDEDAPEQNLALYPLLLEVSAGSADTSDRADKLTRHEVWLPLWEEPLTPREYRDRVLMHLRFRVENQVVDTLDLLEQLASRSQYLGFQRYCRVGFWPRKGQASFAVPIAIVAPGVTTDLGAELRSWRRAARPKADQSNGTYALLLSLQNRLAAFQQGAASPLEVLVLLGRIERRRSTLSKPGDLKYLLPVPALSARWVTAIYGQSPSPELRLAIALASMAVRSHLFRSRYSPDKQRYFWSDRVATVAPIQSLNSLCDYLLDHWLRAKEGDRPGHRWAIAANPLDLQALILGELDEAKIVEFVCGLALCTLPSKPDERLWTLEHAPLLPEAYRQAARLQWERDRVLPAAAIRGLTNGSTLPLLRQMRAQAVTARLPPAIADGRRIAMALAFPVFVPSLFSEK